MTIARGRVNYFDKKSLLAMPYGYSITDVRIPRRKRLGGWKWVSRWNGRDMGVWV